MERERGAAGRRARRAASAFCKALGMAGAGNERRRGTVGVGVGVCNPSARYSRVVTFSCVGASLPRLVSVCVYTFLFPALLDFAVRCKRLFFGYVWAFCSCFGLVWF